MSRIQTDEPDRAAEVDYDDGGDGASEFVGHYVVPEDEIAPFGDANFGTIASPYLLVYARGSLSIDTVYGIRGDTEGIFPIGD